MKIQKFILSIEEHSLRKETMSLCSMEDSKTNQTPDPLQMKVHTHTPSPNSIKSTLTPKTLENSFQSRIHTHIHIYIPEPLQRPSNTLHQHHPLLQTNLFLGTKDSHIQRPILNGSFNINRMLFSVSHNLLNPSSLETCIPYTPSKHSHLQAPWGFQSQYEESALLC